MMKTRANTLLIVGNGFDLQCGLKSSYSDFFDWLRQDKGRINDNIWTFHFLNSTLEGRQWINVEDCLLKAIIGNDMFVKHGMIHKWAKEAISTGALENPESIKTPEARFIRYYCMHQAPHDSYWFLDELIKFENQFSEYLQSEIEGNNKYLSNIISLLRLLTGSKKVNIVSFNYTNPFKVDPTENLALYYIMQSMVGTVTNVHGTYEDGNIIFGVDATEDLSQETHIFTKTHRKMMQENSDRALIEHVDKVIFYGHSLGEADYSYFQSIFDSYNLYGDSLIHRTGSINPVTLQFYFTIYDKSSETKIKREATAGVYKLITAYGDTIDNKDKGKNLLHKLLLEGRIQIKFLPDLQEITPLANDGD